MSTAKGPGALSQSPDSQPQNGGAVGVFSLLAPGQLRRRLLIVARHLTVVIEPIHVSSTYVGPRRIRKLCHQVLKGLFPFFLLTQRKVRLRFSSLHVLYNQSV
jgi:hypothetical protein